MTDALRLELYPFGNRCGADRARYIQRDGADRRRTARAIGRNSDTVPTQMSIKTFRTRLAAQHQRHAEPRPRMRSRHSGGHFRDNPRARLTVTPDRNLRSGQAAAPSDADRLMRRAFGLTREPTNAVNPGAGVLRMKMRNHQARNEEFEPSATSSQPAVQRMGFMGIPLNSSADAEPGIQDSTCDGLEAEPHALGRDAGYKKKRRRIAIASAGRRMKRRC